MANLVELCNNFVGPDSFIVGPTLVANMLAIDVDVGSANLLIRGRNSRWFNKKKSNSASVAATLPASA